MPISKNALEEAILALLCFNNDHAPSVALKIQDISLFSNRSHQTIAEVAIDHVQKFGVAPNAALEYLLEDKFRHGEEGKLLAQTVDLLGKQATGIEPAFVLEELDRFFEQRKLETALIDSMDALKQGDIAAARDAIYRNVAPHISKVTNQALWLKNPKQALSFLAQLEDPEFFSSGVDAFDIMKIRPKRKTLIFLIAAKGKGKSWWLVNLGKAGLQYHHKVLHITLEMSQEDVMKRYIQSFFSLTEDEVQQIKVPVFTQNGNGRIVIDTQIIERSPILAKRREIVQRINGMISYPDLVVQEFPTGTLSSDQLSLYLDSLARDQGFIPDILIIDYADLMKVDSANLRIDTGRLYKDLRGIGVARNMAVVTASQGNRESEEAKLVTGGNVAEDWSKNGTADGVLTYSQTVEEFRMGLARLFVDKFRGAPDRFITLVSQAYAIGQFSLGSVLMNPELANDIKNLTGTT